MMMTTRMRKTKTDENSVFSEVRIYDKNGKLKKTLSPKRLLTRHWNRFGDGRMSANTVGKQGGKKNSNFVEFYSYGLEPCSLEEINFTGI